MTYSRPARVEGAPGPIVLACPPSDPDDPEDRGRNGTRGLAVLAAAADDAPSEPFGAEWSITENQPCQVWNYGMDEELAPFIWSGGCVDGKASADGDAMTCEWHEDELVDGSCVDH